MNRRKVLLFLMVAAVLLSISGSSRSEARASPSSVSSGGQYVLTIQTIEATQSAGYRLQPAATAIDPAAGCCCKTNLPCVIK